MVFVLKVQSNKSYCGNHFQRGRKKDEVQQDVAADEQTKGDKNGEDKNGHDRLMGHVGGQWQEAICKMKAIPSHSYISFIYNNEQSLQPIT